MSKWLDKARSYGDGRPDAKNAKTAKTPETAEMVGGFGINDSFGMTTADERVAFEERAAICEHDGGLPRSHAELIAAACLIPLALGETLERREATIIHFAEHLDRLKRKAVPPNDGGPDAA